MTLYEIKENIKNAVENIEVDEETGEILNIAALEDLQEQFEDKVENIALYVKNINAEAEAVKNEEKKLAMRRKALENKSERLKTYIHQMMSETGTEKVDTPRVLIGFRKSSAVEVDDGFIEWAEKNAEFLLDYKPPTASKTAIKNAIKNGSALEFARIVESKSLTIR